jgi:hypothetical protein
MITSVITNTITEHVKKDVIVCDCARLENKCPICNSIMWFIFDLQRKNKQLQIASIDTCVQELFISFLNSSQGPNWAGGE